MLGQLAWSGFTFVYGFANLLMLSGVAVIRDKTFIKKSITEEHKRELAKAQEKYWGLNNSPVPGFKHAFHTLKSGVKLHYVVHRPADAKSKNVAIFVHGWPDSYLLWKYIFNSPSLAGYTLIAVDLPGFGGSDGLPRYGPNEVLETITGFILAMRQEFVQEDGKLVMVAHDWGGIIAARLASEAKELADRWIIAGAVIPAQLRSNTTTLLASSKQMLHTFLFHPFNTRLLKSAYKTAQPVFSQLSRSFYIFIFQLPAPIANTFITMGDAWFLNLLHKIQAGVYRRGVKNPRNLTPQEYAEHMSIAAGPGTAQFKDKVGGQGYSESVRKRVPTYGMPEKIRLYREQLAFGVWEKSIETVVALSEIPVSPSRSGSGAGLFEDGPRGALKGPATIIGGKNDTAFEHKLGMNGIGDYLPKNSQVLILENTAHWLQTEEFGRKKLTEAVAWALEGEIGTLRERIGSEGVQFVLEK